MGLFKKAVDKEIHDGAWGYLLNVHKVDADTLAREMRCVEREGIVDGKAVTLMRVFKPRMAGEKGVKVSGWETFDAHPDLILFEGYLTKSNQVFLEKKR
ncbi:MAG: hypothetical protein HY671_12595 [Chloroflexi bacterium]|nr:hypothetical protein [Chloroflexota bacterium]